MILVRVERKEEETIKNTNRIKREVLTKNKVSNHLLGNVANLRQRKKNSRVVACRGCAVPRRNLFDFHTLRPKQYSSDVRTTQTELISSFSRTCFSQTFSFLFCPIFFSFILLFIYLSHLLYNLFFPSFLICKDLRNSHIQIIKRSFVANEMKSNFIVFLII